MKINFGGVVENVVTREEFPLEKAKKTLENKLIAVLGYGVQGPAQSMNLKDNGFNVIVGQYSGDKEYWKKAIADGWIPGRTLFEIEEAAKKGDIVSFLIGDAGQVKVWPDKVKPFITHGKTLYVSHGMPIHFSNATGIIPPNDVNVIMVAPKGAGSTVRKLFKEGKGINSSYAVHQAYFKEASDIVRAMGIGIGSGYMFETTVANEVISDHFGERNILLGGLDGLVEADYYISMARGMSKKDAFIHSSEQLTQVILPLIGKGGFDAIYKQARKAGQLGTVRMYQEAIFKASMPLMHRLYTSVANGTEAEIAIRENGKPGYKARLDAELATLDNSEMWKIGQEVRETSNNRDYWGKITNFALAGAIIGAISAQYYKLISEGHSPSEVINESKEELTESLNLIYKEKGIATLMQKCSTTAQRGALDWAPIFFQAYAPVFAGLKPEYKNAKGFDPWPEYTFLNPNIPNIQVVDKVNMGLRP